MSFFKWSRTASSNATADSTVNYVEGQAPSSLNDSARAAMAALAKYRDDISGAIATGGSSTAYTVTTYQSFDTLAHLDGQIVAFTPHTTNGATVTLAVDGLTAKPLRSAPSVELPAGVLVQGTPYIALYNNSNGEFYLHGFYGNPYNVPIGGGMFWFDTTAPNSSFIFPYGQAISRTTYATLFARWSTQYGVGDGSSTFNVINLAGYVPAFKDDMSGSAAGRITTAGSGIDGTTLGASGGAQTVTVAQANLPVATLTTTITDTHFHYVANTDSSGTALSISSANTMQRNLSTGGVESYQLGGTATAANVGKSSTVAGGGGSITASTALGGSGTALNKMPPTKIVNLVIGVI